MPLPTVADIKLASLGLLPWNPPSQVGFTDAQIEYVRDNNAAPLYAGMSAAPDYGRLVALHTCHFLWRIYVALINGGKGFVTGSSAGEVSVSYAGAPYSGAGFEGTPYGDALRTLRAAQGPFVMAGSGPAPKFRG